MNRDIKGYYFITDSGLSLAGNASDVRLAVEAGARVIQYREKHACGRDMFSEALRLRKLCRDAIFLVNDRLDIAIACGADGVHIGQEDIPCFAARKILGQNKVIGVTVHSASQAVKAVAEGADYIAVSPVFDTSTKKDAGRPGGIDLVSAVRKTTKKPLVAIGGITLSNAESVIRAGADAVCAISCVVARGNVVSEIGRFMDIFVKTSRKVR